MRFLLALLLGLAAVFPASAQMMKADGINFAIDACVRPFPTFAATDDVATKAGGQTLDDSDGLALLAYVDDGVTEGFWMAAEPHPKNWSVKVTRGTVAGSPARSCIVIVSGVSTAEMRAALDAQWPLADMGQSQRDLIGFTSRYFSANINGVAAAVILHDPGVVDPDHVATVFTVLWSPEITKLWAIETLKTFNGRT